MLDQLKNSARATVSISYDDIEDVKYTGYGSGPFGGPAFGGQSSQYDCPTSPRYSGDSITLRSTPRDGIGPYSVVFKIGEDPIPFYRLTSPLGITSNPTTKTIVEDTTVGGTYILTDEDVRTSNGTITFSAHIEDSCPTTSQTCTETCIVNIGCLAPVCNFTVT